MSEFEKNILRMAIYGFIATFSLYAGYNMGEFIKRFI